MRYEYEDDEGEDADYGVFADNSPIIPRKITETELRQQKYCRDKKEREERVSREFNSHMIYLFNERNNK